jgi:hypothetical protein
MAISVATMSFLNSANAIGMRKLESMDGIQEYCNQALPEFHRLFDAAVAHCSDEERVALDAARVAVLEGLPPIQEVGASDSSMEVDLAGPAEDPKPQFSLPRNLQECGFNYGIQSVHPYVNALRALLYQGSLVRHECYVDEYRRDVSYGVLDRKDGDSREYLSHYILDSLSQHSAANRKAVDTVIREVGSGDTIEEFACFFLHWLRLNECVHVIDIGGRLQEITKPFNMQSTVIADARSHQEVIAACEISNFPPLLYVASLEDQKPYLQKTVEIRTETHKNLYTLVGAFSPSEYSLAFSKDMTFLCCNDKCTASAVIPYPDFWESAGDKIGPCTGVFYERRYSTPYLSNPLVDLEDVVGKYTDATLDDEGREKLFAALCAVEQLLPNFQRDVCALQKRQKIRVLHPGLIEKVSTFTAVVTNVLNIQLSQMAPSRRKAILGMWAKDGKMEPTLEDLKSQWGSAYHYAYMTGCSETTL